MAVEFCKTCKVKQVKIAKWGLCSNCYQSFNRERKFTSSSHRELDFVKVFFNHENWQHHPCIFRLEGCNYEPDFYDGERNVFIEVVGSKQALQQNKAKYYLFRRMYPKIAFEVRYSNGDLLDLDDKKLFHKEKRRNKQN